MSISLLPIIPAFEYYQGLSIPFDQINQIYRATSSHPQDNGSFVMQQADQHKGWPLTLAALEDDGGSMGAFTKAEYILIMNAARSRPVLTLNYHDILDAQKVFIESVGLRPLLGTSDYDPSTLFVGSINFIRI